MVSLKRLAAASGILTVLLAAWLQQRWALSRLTSTGLAIALIFIEVFLIFCYHAYVYPFYFSPLKDIPMPQGYSPLLGHAFLDLGKDKVQGTSLRSWPQKVPHNGIIRFIDVLHNEKIIPVSAAALTDILTTKCYDWEKPHHFKSGSALAILGNGLLFAEGDPHKRQRKQLNPAFSFRHVRDLFPKYWDVSVAMVKGMEAEADETTGRSTVDVNDWASRVTLDILGQAGLGRDFGGIVDPNNRITRAYREAFSQGWIDIVFTIFEILIGPDFFYSLPFPRNNKLRGNMNVIREVCTDLVAEKQTQKPQSDDVPTTDILSAVFSSTAVDFTRSEMVEQLVTFLVAGHETTAAALSWSIFIFCKKPEIQSRLREEVRKHLPKTAWTDKNATISSSDLEPLIHLQAFCNEILRFYPPVPGTMRHAVVDTTVAGHHVPAGTDALLAPWAVNVSTALWGDDAGEFNPERWLESASGGCKSNYANLTFLHGPRSCIGQSFAKGEFQCLVAAWVGWFETEFATQEDGWKEPKTDMMSGISVRPTRGWKANVKVVDW